jgi:uncharacterized protein (TIGR00725 family)
MTRLPIVGVLGSGGEPHEEKARPLGEWLAYEGVHLLTGGGGGVMEAVSAAFHRVPNRKGLVIGILPGEATDSGYFPKPGYPNPWVEIPIYTHLPKSGKEGTDPFSRNHINVLSADVLIALPGSPGTASEVVLALRYGRPVIAYLKSRDEIPNLPGKVEVTSDLEAVKGFVREHLKAEG